MVSPLCNPVTLYPFIDPAPPPLNNTNPKSNSTGNGMVNDVR